MKKGEQQIITATLALYDLTDRIKALKESFETCDPVKRWRDDMNYNSNDVTEPEPDFCAKREPLVYIDWDACQYRLLDPASIAEHIAKKWCPACQRNSPKVVEWKRLRRTVAAAKARVTMAVRRHRKEMEVPA